jgi:hypothetical protein
LRVRDDERAGAGFVLGDALAARHRHRRRRPGVARQVRGRGRARGTLPLPLPRRRGVRSGAFPPGLR